MLSMTIVGFFNTPLSLFLNQTKHKGNLWTKEYDAMNIASLGCHDATLSFLRHVRALSDMDFAKAHSK